MGKYTTEVRFICEQAYKDKYNTDIDSVNVNDIIEEGIKKIFWQDENKFEIYDENHREELCKRIIRHYYTREIAAETFGLWKLWINERMCLIMDYYNGLYESAALKYNPLINVDYSRTGIKNDVENGNSNINRKDVSVGVSNENGNNENHSENEGNERSNNIRNNETYDRYSDTPQNGLNNVKNGEYLTNADIKSEAGQNSTESKNNGSEDSNGSYNRNNVVQNNNNSDIDEIRNNVKQGDWIEEVKGKMDGQSYAKLIKEYRENILNIDEMIIKELKDLFFLLW